MKITRTNTISYSPDNINIPFIRLQNKFIEKAGFKVGDKIQVTYYEDAKCIFIKKSDDNLVVSDDFEDYLYKEIEIDYEQGKLF